MNTDNTPPPTDDPKASNAASAGCMARLVRLFNKYGSTAESEDAEHIENLLTMALDEIVEYIEKNDVCPRDTTGWCVTIITQRMAEYTLKRAFALKRRERESQSLTNRIYSYGLRR